jgi:hypothetical protein
MSEIVEWTSIAKELLRAGHDIFATSNVLVTEKGYGDEKYLALTLLARTMSNLRGALLLLEHRRVIEGRIITRCCLENSYWVAGLIDEGEAFSRKMLGDDAHHRQQRGQRLIETGAPLGDEMEAKLRAWLKANEKRFQNPTQLNPMSVAMRTDIGRSYIFYEQLSSDSCHPTIEALNRHVIPHTIDEIGGVDVEPVARDVEIAETLEYLCMGVLGVCIGVDQLLGGTRGGAQLNALADRYIEISNRAANRRRSAAPVGGTDNAV